MDLTTIDGILKMLANNGLAIFLVIYYVLKQSKRDEMLIKGFSEMTTTFSSLNKTLESKLN